MTTIRETVKRRTRQKRRERNIALFLKRRANRAAFASRYGDEQPCNQGGARPRLCPRHGVPVGRPVAESVDDARRMIGAAREARDAGLHDTARTLAGAARAAMRIVRALYPRGRFQTADAGAAVREAGDLLNEILAEFGPASGVAAPSVAWAAGPAADTMPAWVHGIAAEVSP